MTKNVQYAGFWSRWFASIIDHLLLDLGTCLLGLLFLGLLYWAQWIGFHMIGVELILLKSIYSFLFQGFLCGIRVVLSFIYFTWGVFKYSTTFGKHWLHISVVSEETLGPVLFKQAALRSISYSVSYLCFYIGFFIVIFHPKKRALHDIIAGTVCIFKRS